MFKRTDQLNAFIYQDIIIVLAEGSFDPSDDQGIMIKILEVLSQENLEE